MGKRKDKNKKYKSFEDLKNDFPPSGNESNINNTKKIIVLYESYNKERKSGFLKCIKHPYQKVFINKTILDENRINLDLLNDNSIFECLVEQDEKGLRAKELKYFYYRIPDDTRKYIFYDGIENFNLKLNKTARFEDDKFLFFKKGKKEIEFFIKPNFDKINFNSIIKRQNNLIEGLGIDSQNRKEFDLSPDWRLIVGLGSESVYETSITLHHIYGIPYIPGQSIKGVVRNWIITEVFENKEGNKNEGALHDKGFCIIFGSPKDSIIGEHQGSVFFFDAFPISAPDIEPDIMNPHYGPYYSGQDKPPADYYNPVPIPFLTVKNTAFKFIIGVMIDEIIQEGEFKDKTLLSITEKYLREALVEHGLGAKTAVGYGYMKKVM